MTCTIGITAPPPTQFHRPIQYYVPDFPSQTPSDPQLFYILHIYMVHYVVNAFATFYFSYVGCDLQLMTFLCLGIAYKKLPLRDFYTFCNQDP